MNQDDEEFERFFPFTSFRASAYSLRMTSPSCHCQADEASRSNQGGARRLPRSRLPSLGGQVARNDIRGSAKNNE